MKNSRMDTNVYSCSISQNGLNLPNHESSWVSPSLTTAKQRSTKSVLFFIYRGIPSGYSSLLALHLSGTPSQRTGSLVLDPLAVYSLTTVYVCIWNTVLYKIKAIWCHQIKKKLLTVKPLFLLYFILSHWNIIWRI